MPRVDTTNDIAIVEFKPAAERNQVTSTHIWRVIGSRSIRAASSAALVVAIAFPLLRISGIGGSVPPIPNR